MDHHETNGHAAGEEIAGKKYARGRRRGVTYGALFLRPCPFVAGAASEEAIPAATHPEIAFWGRSNVGKSSLLNALTGQKALARHSQTPGRTRQINFFLLAEALMLVDLPGYGYAQASKKDIKAWTELTRRYLCGRTSLRRALLLIDARRGVSKTDEEPMRMLDDAAVAYQLVLTKTDKLTASELERVTQATQAAAARHPAALREIAVTSAAKGYGIEALRAELALL
jgi:GTP-binding protein